MIYISFGPVDQLALPTLPQVEDVLSSEIACYVSLKSCGIEFCTLASCGEHGKFVLRLPERCGGFVAIHFCDYSIRYEIMDLISGKPGWTEKVPVLFLGVANVRHSRVCIAVRSDMYTFRQIHSVGEAVREVHSFADRIVDRS